MEPTEQGAAPASGGIVQPPVVAAVVTHMNDDHATDCLTLCQVAADRRDLTAARLVSLDEEGLDFEATGADGSTTAVRILWRRPLLERADIRHQVAEMTHDARDRLAAHRDPPTSGGPGASLGGAALLLALLVVALLGGPAPRAHAQASPDPLVAPVTTLSADGRTATDGVRSLTVSQVVDLDPAGGTVTVTGSGYDVQKGVYVAFCLIPATNQAPTPCGGGADTTGTTGSSSWISSNPPSYGEGVARPYGAGGTFSVTFSVSPLLSGGLDCRLVRCAVVTRNDHTRSTDRSQDIFVPVSFLPAAVPGTRPPPGPTTTLPPSTVAPTTVPTTLPTTTTEPPPDLETSADGRTVTDGTRTVEVSRVADLDPADATVTVSGTGFDPSRGVYVSLCRAAATDAPGPTCLTGSTGASAWVSSDPPAYAADLAVPYDDGGTFEVEVTLQATIDGETDCREVECAVVVRDDDEVVEGRARDLAVPVAFAEAVTTTAAPAGEETAAAAPGSADVDDADGGDGGNAVLPALLAVLLVGAAGGAWFLVSRRGRAPVSPA
jgi:hypothetical protein